MKIETKATFNDYPSRSPEMGESIERIDFIVELAVYRNVCMETHRKIPAVQYQTVLVCDGNVCCI